MQTWLQWLSLRNLWLSRTLGILLIDDFAPVACWYTLLTTLGTAPTLVFTNIHMDAFVRVHGLLPTDVAWAQGGFAFWNPINDVLGAYLSDYWFLKHGSRLRLVQGLSVVWVLSSVLPFIDLPWLTPAIHYFLAIFIFDGLLSLCCVCRVALMAELASDEPRRVRLQRWNSAFGNVEGIITSVAFWLWDPVGDLRGFRIFLMVATFVSVAAICLASGQIAVLGRGLSGKHVEAAGMEAAGLSDGSQNGFSVMDFFTRLRSHRNFWLFCGVNCLLEVQVVFSAQFNMALVNVLLDDKTRPFRFAVLSSIAATGGVAAFLASFVAERHGVHAVFFWSCRVKVVVAGTLLLLGSHAHWLCICMFLGANQACVQVVQAFAPVCVSNLADENVILAAHADTSGNSEKGSTEAARGGSPVSVMLGMSSLLAKPFGSIAPVVGAMLLSRFKEKQMDSESPIANDVDGNDLRVTALSTATGVALVAGLAQMLLLSKYTLHGRRLKEIQARAHDMQLRSCSEFTTHALPQK